MKLSVKWTKDAGVVKLTNATSSTISRAQITARLAAWDDSRFVDRPGEVFINYSNDIEPTTSDANDRAIIYTTDNGFALASCVSNYCDVTGETEGIWRLSFNHGPPLFFSYSKGRIQPSSDPAKPPIPRNKNKKV